MDIRLKKYLKNSDALLISSVSNIKYLISDFGFSDTERECFLLITKDKQYVITDKRYSEVIEKQLPNFEVIDAGANYFLTKSAQDFFKKFKIKNLAFEENDLKVEEYNKLKKFVNLSPASLKELRIIKTSKEIENIKSACRIGDQVFKFIIKKLKIGVSEKEIAWEIEKFLREKDVEASFRPIVAFGKNSSVPHHLCGDTKLKMSQIVLLDFGVKVNSYCSDMTRTVFFGKAPEEFKRTYEIVLKAQEKAIKSVSIGTKASQVDKAARSFIINQKHPNIPHSVGHGIGIEVHEAPHVSPSSETKVKEGMVFSIEPGIYIPGWGGIRIEDLVLATRSGTELISHAERSLIEI